MRLSPNVLIVGTISWRLIEMPVSDRFARASLMLGYWFSICVSNVVLEFDIRPSVS